jgi:hypothetical protein
VNEEERIYDTLEKLAIEHMGIGLQSKNRGLEEASWDDLACMSTLVTGWRTVEVGDDVYNKDNAMAYCHVQPDVDLEFKAIGTFIGAMGSDYVVIGWQDYETASDTNPATGLPWEDGDVMYMGHYEPEALEKRWLLERLHVAAIHKSTGLMVEVINYINFNPETHSYDVGSSLTNIGTVDTNFIEEGRCIRMAKSFIGGKNIYPALLATSRAHITTNHRDQPHLHCEEAYRALIDAWASHVLQSEGGDNVSIVLNAADDSVRSEIFTVHAKSHGAELVEVPDGDLG